MKLVTNGCSFTWGAEILLAELGFSESDPRYGQNIDFYIDFRTSRTYTYHLHDKLKTSNYDNLSMGGASNQRIVRTTLDYFMPKLLNDEDLSEHIAVIQWTEPSREEVYHDGFYYTVSARGFWAEPELMDELNTTYRDYIKGRLLLEDKNYVNQFVSDVILLSSFFELHKIKYIFCHIASPQWKMPELDAQVISKINWLGKNYKDSSIRKLIDDVQQKENISLNYPENHPNIEGHKFIAETLYKRLKELYNL
jgi:hypothetical protein